MKILKYIFPIVLILLGYFTYSYITKDEMIIEGDKCIDIIVQIEEVKTYKLCTDSNYLSQVIDENEDLFQASYNGSKDDPFGRVLASLQGYSIKDNEFFFIYVNDVYGSYGIDQQVIEDNITYELRLDTY